MSRNLLVVYFQGLCAMALNNSNPRKASRGRAMLVGAGFSGDTLNNKENLDLYRDAFQQDVSVCQHEPHLTFPHSHFDKASGNLTNFTIAKPDRITPSRELLGLIPLRGKRVRFRSANDLGEVSDLGGELDVTRDFVEGLIRLPGSASLRDDMLKGQEPQRVTGLVEIEAGQLYAQRRIENSMFFRHIGSKDEEPNRFNQDAALYLSGGGSKAVVEITSIEDETSKATLTLYPDSRIVISNLCSATSHPPAELDFLAYYELLSAPPPMKQRKIPHAPPYETKTGSGCPPTFVPKNVEL